MDCVERSAKVKPDSYALTVIHSFVERFPILALLIYIGGSTDFSKSANVGKCRSPICVVNLTNKKLWISIRKINVGEQIWSLFFCRLWWKLMLMQQNWLQILIPFIIIQWIVWSNIFLLLGIKPSCHVLIFQ